MRRTEGKGEWGTGKETVEGKREISEKAERENVGGCGEKESNDKGKNLLPFWKDAFRISKRFFRKIFQRAFLSAATGKGSLQRKQIFSIS